MCEAAPDAGGLLLLLLLLGAAIDQC